MMDGELSVLEQRLNKYQNTVAETCATLRFEDGEEGGGWLVTVG